MSRIDPIVQNGATAEHYPSQFYITTNKLISGSREHLVSWPNTTDQQRFEQKHNCKVIHKEPAE